MSEDGDQCAASSGPPSAPPTAFISWAHRNEDWTDAEAATWEQTVRAFAEQLRGDGIDVDFDLWHTNDPAVDWSRFGPAQIQDADFVLVVVSAAWRQRWEGRNNPAQGAGAVGEANTLRGLFERHQAHFQRRTLLIRLGDASDDDIPPELSTLNRFWINLHTVGDQGFEDLLRTITGQPRYLRPPLGTPRRFTPEPSALTSVAVPNRMTVTDDAREKWLAEFASLARSRVRLRRSGAGLSSAQLEAIDKFRPRLPSELRDTPTRGVHVLVGELGTGKSEAAEEWLRLQADAAAVDSNSPLPMWISVEDLDEPIESVLLDRFDQGTLSDVGVSLVVDGLDQRTDRAPSTLRQAAGLTARWPKSAVLITSRSPQGVDPADLVTMPTMRREESTALIEAVAGTSTPTLDAALLQAAGRPLFALLIGQHAAQVDGVTGIHELVELVVDDVVHEAAGDLYPLLRRLAIETLRTGSPIDPARFCDSSQAATVRKSPLVTTSGRRCGFSLATFEQWFASRAILDGDIEVSDLLVSLAVFDRWKYVLSMILAAGEPTKADAVMGEVMRWNPGAAAWMIDDMGRGGLARRRPDISADDWEEAGLRLRQAMTASLEGLGPFLGSAFSIFRLAQTQEINDVTLGIEIEDNYLTLGWTTVSKGDAGTPLRVVPLRKIHNDAGPLSIKRVPLPTTQNWPWEVVRSFLSNDLGKSLPALADRALTEFGSQTAKAECAAARDTRPEFGLYPWLSHEESRPAVYPGPDKPASGEISEPWGQFSTARMLERVEAIIAAALDIYLELTQALTPSFGDTLAHRGLMPVQFYGTMTYDPVGSRGRFDLPGPTEPGILWLLRPVGDANRQVPLAGANDVDITPNDSHRASLIRDRRESFYAAYRSYVESNPVYEAFAGSFTTSSGRMPVFSKRPATKMALEWLASDLKHLGWMDASIPQSF